MALLKLHTSNLTLPLTTRQGFLLGHGVGYRRSLCLPSRLFSSFTRPQQEAAHSKLDLAKSKSEAAEAAASSSSPDATRSDTASSPGSSNESMPLGWEDSPNWDITDFSQLPHRHFGHNQHMRINAEFKEALRQMLWHFRAPIRYAFAYGSGVFPQSDAAASGSSLSPHPHPPEAILKWQRGGGKMIDFVFGVTYTQHWHSLNLNQHRDHYSFLGSLGSGIVSRVQDNYGAGVYFNPYVTIDGTLIKYGVVNLDTLARDLSTWDTLYLAGRLQKPVKILRDDARVRYANQVNLISAVRTALLMLGPSFTERELYSAIAGMSYMGDPRMSFNAEHPNKVLNIVKHQMLNFRQLYDPLIGDLPNVTYNDPRVKSTDWIHDTSVDVRLVQDMDPVKRGNMVRRLPSAFRGKIYNLYQRKFKIPGRDFQAVLNESRDEDESGFKKRQGGEFDRRIAKEDDIREMVGKAIHQTVKWPSTTQSLKGPLTAGPARTWRYIQEKRGKSRKGKKEKEEKGKKEKEEKGKKEKEEKGK